MPTFREDLLVFDRGFRGELQRLRAHCPRSLRFTLKGGILELELKTVVTNEGTYPDPVRAEWKFIAQQRAETPGISVPQLAQLVGRNDQTVRVWLRSPAYQAYENWVFSQTKQSWTPYERAHRVETTEMFVDHSAEMAQRLLAIAETTKDEKLAASISQDWLDRAGFAPKRTETTRSNTFVLTEGAMKELLRRADEAAGPILVGEVIRKSA